MPACLQHPQVESTGTCEYCAQPHCAACLRQYLGRWYCPACYVRVHTLATGAPPPGAAPTRSARAPSWWSAGDRTPRLPGWLSALIYLAGFLVVLYAGQSVTAGPLMLVEDYIGGFRGPQPAAP